MIKCKLCIEEDNLEKLTLILEEEVGEPLTISDIMNQDGLTLLHQVSILDKQKCMNQIILSYKKCNENRKDYNQLLKRWVNAQTVKDSFSALHYASYMGNYEMCKLLIEIGADTSAVNNNGLNVLHIAAQGD